MQSLDQGTARPDDGDARSTLTLIRLQHDRKAELVLGHEPLDATQFLRRRQRAIDEGEARHEIARTRQTPENLDLRLANEPTRGHARIRRREQRRASMFHHQRRDVSDDRWIEHPRRPELPPCRTPPLRQQQAASFMGATGLHVGWMPARSSRYARNGAAIAESIASGGFL